MGDKLTDVEVIAGLVAEVHRLRYPKEVQCPFCKEDDFDLIGLKFHLTRCTQFAETPNFFLNNSV